MSNNDLGFLDLLSIIGFSINIENLKLNKQQSQTLMSELTDNQDSMLKEIIAQNKLIIEQNKEIIAFLRGSKK